MISAILVGVIVLAGWTVTGAQWVAVADQQRELTKQVTKKNTDAINNLSGRISLIELNTGLTQRDTEATKEDVKDIKRKVDKIYDHLLANPNSS